MLLVYDGTDEAQAALARCAALSRALSAAVDVVAIVDPVTANAQSAGLLSDLAHHRLEEFARRELQCAIGKLADDGIAARGYVRFGRAADAIAAHAMTTRPDLVVVGHSARSGFARWWRERPVHLDLAERLRGAALIVVTVPAA
ncbi:MAG: universal stress protein [Burkholderia sp.]|jgi:nucleotide-binding universal stress UspA family protein|uniref:universal stress protein n=1 Tax=Burkholderia sp. TaxID=36773 RepID=UPI00281F3C56|nr:universal stress protein [Burkholderia sp.]MDR0246306.1 universal stress protein [Burkholderia sp.]